MDIVLVRSLRKFARWKSMLSFTNSLLFGDFSPNQSQGSVWKVKMKILVLLVLADKVSPTSFKLDVWLVHTMDQVEHTMLSMTQMFTEMIHMFPDSSKTSVLNCFLQTLLTRSVKLSMTW